MPQLKRSLSSTLLSPASARKIEEPVVYRVTPPSSPYIYPLTRAFSVTELNNVASKIASKYSSHYKPMYHSYFRDWDLGNRSDSSRKHFSLGYPHYSRYHPDYPESFYPSSFKHHSKGSYPTSRYDPGSKYKVDYFDSSYWNARLDPYAVQAFPGRQYSPWSFRPKIYENMDTSSAVRMYKQGLIGYETFEKYWIKPTGWYNYYLGKM